MRSYEETDKYDAEEALKIGALPWQLEILKLNPSYTCWGPHEDYMINNGQWSQPIIRATWKEFGPWELDELNECVNFYFSVERASKQCPICDGNGYHADAQRVVNTFYAHSNPEGEHWNDNITQDEVQALVNEGRLRDFTHGKPAGYIPTAEEVNQANRRGSRNLLSGHDAINRHILIAARLKRLGVEKFCGCCKGTGHLFTAPECHISLTLWMLHPRKGCSQGVEVSRIEQSELPEVFAWLKEAAQRNADRFAKVLNK